MARRTNSSSVDVVTTLERNGPLGADNRRRQLGRSQRLDPDGQIQRETLVQAGAVRKEERGPSLGESLSQSLVISCSKRLDPSSAQEAANPTDLKARVEGVVSWGGDGHQCQARFDFLEGTTLRVSGSFVRVDAELVDELDDTAPTSAVEVGAFVGYGQGYRGAQLTRRAVTTALATAAEFDVPEFARDVAIWWPGNACNVDMYSGGTLLYSSPALDTDSVGVPLKLPGGVSSIVVAGSSNGPIIVVWGLDL